jgi:MerR family mercuric resistance operon transcriptional regulator
MPPARHMKTQSKRDGGTSEGDSTPSPTAEATAQITIGALAQLSGVRAETIRFYEREGVIPVARRAGAGDYRRYYASDAQRLEFVRRARDLGFSLDEVRELLALADGDPNRPCSDVNRIARAHLRQVRAKLVQLAALRDELTRLITACDTNDGIADCSLLAALNGDDDKRTGSRNRKP